MESNGNTKLLFTSHETAIPTNINYNQLGFWEETINYESYSLPYNRA